MKDDVKRFINDQETNESNCQLQLQFGNHVNLLTKTVWVKHKANNFVLVLYTFRNKMYDHPVTFQTFYPQIAQRAKEHFLNTSTPLKSHNFFGVTLQDGFCFCFKKLF